jgi:hypothetical protein
VGASGYALATDGTATQAAANVFFTQTGNGAGVYRVPVGGAASATPIWTGGDCTAVTQQGTTLYFAAPSNAIMDFDFTQATPTVRSFTTLSSAPQAMMSDGANLYVLDGNGVLYAVALTTANATTLATSGPNAGVVATDGVNVYVAGGNDGLFRVPISGGGGAYSGYTYAATNQFPGDAPFQGVLVTSSAIYFATNSDVYRAHK